MTETEITEPCLHPQDWPPPAPVRPRTLAAVPASIPQAMSTLGAVTLATRAKAQQVMDYCRAEFGRNPGVLWGKDSNPANSEHYSGRAVDFMITHHGRGVDSDLGDAITRYLLARAADWDLAWVIWAQRLYYPDGTSYLMEDRGSTTNNHRDHPHAYWRSDRLITGSRPVPNYTDRQSQEEDDMPITQQDADLIAATILARQVTDLQPGGGKTTLGETIAEARAHHLDVLRTVGQTPDAILDTPVARGGRGTELGPETSLRAMVSYADDHTIQLIDRIGQTVVNATGADPEVVKRAVREAIESLTVTVEVAK